MIQASTRFFLSEEDVSSFVQLHADQVTFPQSNCTQQHQVKGKESSKKPADVGVPQRSKHHGGQEKIPHTSSHESSHEKDKFVAVVPGANQVRPIPLGGIWDRKVQHHHQNPEEQKEQRGHKLSRSPLQMKNPEQGAGHSSHQDNQRSYKEEQLPFHGFLDASNSLPSNEALPIHPSRGHTAAIGFGGEHCSLERSLWPLWPPL
mmetsp:Transcript_39506/g.85265  ORF Transcript_39506/g.85265 Transcript_39506/m.85265 type:complete len:204 (+) Transcript_39506:355-966(+)